MSSFIRRYRKCIQCKFTFTTHQSLEEYIARSDKNGKLRKRAPASKLTVEDVKRMRAAAAEGKSTFECSLECECDCTVSTAYKVISGRTWAWVK
jgi:transcriptional regulator NrdR family protein